MTFADGSRLGPYEIVSLLGAGGMGEVYRAQDTRLGREVAVKVLPSRVSADPDRLRRFEKEARSASSLGGASCRGPTGTFEVSRNVVDPGELNESSTGLQRTLRDACGRGVDH